MKRLLATAGLLFASACAFAQVAKPCEDLKAEIAKKLEAKNVTSYSLEIVEKEKDAEGKVVGTCEGGSKKVVYRRTSTPPTTPVPEVSKP
jgi:outer membrane lipoprotein-sorting protein